MWGTKKTREKECGAIKNQINMSGKFQREENCKKSGKMGKFSDKKARQNRQFSRENLEKVRNFNL